jgi:hypothetical protein
VKIRRQYGYLDSRETDVDLRALTLNIKGKKGLLIIEWE